MLVDRLSLDSKIGDPKEATAMVLALLFSIKTNEEVAVGHSLAPFLSPGRSIFFFLFFSLVKRFKADHLGILSYTICVSK